MLSVGRQSFKLLIHMETQRQENKAPGLKVDRESWIRDDDKGSSDGGPLLCYFSHETGGSHAAQAIYKQGMLLRSAHHGLPTVRPESTPAAFLSRKSGNTDNP